VKKTLPGGYWALPCPVTAAEPDSHRRTVTGAAAAAADTSLPHRCTHSHWSPLNEWSGWSRWVERRRSRQPGGVSGPGRKNIFFFLKKIKSSRRNLSKLFTNIFIKFKNYFQACKVSKELCK